MSDRFEKFTESARRVLTLAQEEAQRFNQNYIGTEHLLLGLVRENVGVAARALNNLGVDLEKVRNAVRFIIGQGKQSVSREIGLTPRSKKVVELAVEEARRMNHHYIGTEHILLGLIREGEGIAAGVLESMGVSLDQVRRQVILILSQPDYIAETAEMSPPFDMPTNRPSIEELKARFADRMNVPSPAETLLDVLGTSMVEQAKTNQLAPVIQREREMERLLTVLSRREDAHPLLVGESGVGKSALVRELALLTASSDTESDIIRVNQGSFVDFMLNPQRVLKLLGQQPQPVILYLPLLDQAVEFASKVSRFAALYDLLHHPKARVIATITPRGYERLKEMEPALARRFQAVQVKEPDEFITLQILRGLKNRYEQHHQVKIEESALETALLLSQKYLTARPQPSKALDLLDEACSLVSLRRTPAPEPANEPKLEKDQRDAIFESLVTDYNVVEVVAVMIGKSIAEIRKELMG
jgi:ATP-dependent Clp protease ATP-binding subunit ClpC